MAIHLNYYYKRKFQLDDMGEGNITNIVNNAVANFVTSTQVNSSINNALSNYATSSQLDDLLSDLSSVIGLKIWRGIVQSNDVNNFFTVNYESAGFTQIPTVMITAISEGNASNTTVGNATTACIMKDSITLTQARGRAKSVEATGLLVGTALNNINTQVSILAIGI